MNKQSISKEKCLIPDLGEDRLISIAAVITARRELREKNTQQTSSFLQRLIGSSSNIKTLMKNANLRKLKLKGIVPQDFAEQEIKFSEVTHNVDDMIDFGFKFQDFLSMGLCGQDLQNFEFRHFKALNATSDDILKTCPSVHDLTNFTAPQLHEIGFTWQKLKSIGVDRTKMPYTQQEMDMYFPNVKGTYKQKTQQIKTIKTGRKKFKF